MKLSITRIASLTFFLLIVYACCRHSSASSPALGAAFLLNSAMARPVPDEARQADPPGDFQINGQAVVRLERKPSGPETKPEFLSATILPGRGMNLFQITARLPGKGIVNVFASPSLEEAAQTLIGGAADVHGVKSFSFGGAFLAPYPNRIRGKLSPDGKNIVTEWNGKTLSLPAVWKGKENPNAELHAIHGLILDRKTDEVTVKTIPDGQSVTGVIHAGDFGGYWPSRTDLTITVTLTGSAVEATITARNVGSEVEPMGIGWHPYFSIPSGDRKQARLHLPASELAEVNNYDDVFPTGKLVPVKGTKYDFTAASGVPLDNIFLDDNFSHLTRTAGQLVVTLTDPAGDYGIHIQGFSDKIKTIQVYAPPDKAFAAIEQQYNFADPFNPNWKKMDTGMVTLQPKEATTWHVRLQLFTPGK